MLLDFDTFPIFMIAASKIWYLVDLDELDLELEGSVSGDDGRETSGTVG